MAEAVANVARRINATVEEGKDSLDLSNCQLISFPDGVFKVLRTVSENIRIVTLADNKMKAISSKFFSTFTQLRGRDKHASLCSFSHSYSIKNEAVVFTLFAPQMSTEVEHLTSINLANNKLPLEKLSAMPALKWLNIKSNPLSSSIQSALQSPYNFEILLTTE
uniref:Leucine rich repeat containing 20 n=1 Tax=Poecilia reticulata TaxID=8081 RepID=A0A3P9MZV9_POERE